MASSSHRRFLKIPAVLFMLHILLFNFQIVHQVMILSATILAGGMRSISMHLMQMRMGFWT